MPRDKKDIEAGLEAKGFKKGSGDHNYYIYYGSDRLGGLLGGTVRYPYRKP